MGPVWNWNRHVHFLWMATLKVFQWKEVFCVLAQYLHSQQHSRANEVNEGLLNMTEALLKKPITPLSLLFLASVAIICQRDSMRNLLRNGNYSMSQSRIQIHSNSVSVCLSYCGNHFPMSQSTFVARRKTRLWSTACIWCKEQKINVMVVVHIL